MESKNTLDLDQLENVSGGEDDYSPNKAKYRLGQHVRFISRDCTVVGSRLSNRCYYDLIDTISGHHYNNVVEEDISPVQ